MQNKNSKIFLSRTLLAFFLGIGLQQEMVAAQYPLLNPNFSGAISQTATQPFKAMSISGASANPVMMSATSIENVSIEFSYSSAAQDINAVSYSIDFTKLASSAQIPAAALAAGVLVQISLVEAANTLKFPNINSFQKSYFWNTGPIAANTLIVMILGLDGTVYAAGACSAFFVPSLAPIAYQVTINSGLSDEVSTAQISMTTATVQGVKIQSPAGSVSKTPAPAAYKVLLFNPAIYGVSALTNPAAFSAVSVNPASNNPIIVNTLALQNIEVGFNYGTTPNNGVIFSLDLTQSQLITPQILQAGLFVRIDLVPAAQISSFSMINYMQPSYYWAGPTAINTTFVSLVDGQGNVYASGGASASLATQYTPASYMVTINSGVSSQVSSSLLPINGASTSIVCIKSPTTPIVPATSPAAGTPYASAAPAATDTSVAQLINLLEVHKAVASSLNSK